MKPSNRIQILRLALAVIGFVGIGCAPADQFEFLSLQQSMPLADEKKEITYRQKSSRLVEVPETEEPDVEGFDSRHDFEYSEAPKKGDLSDRGTIRPTIYYYVKIDEDKSSCSRDINIRDGKGVQLLRVCKTTATSCALQGSCAVVQSGKTHNLNILKRVDGEDRFFEIDADSCPFGYGVSSSCLDPFYTIAADLDFYKAGSVIYVPSVVGLELPDGSKHNGYFVVRDRGRAIKGAGRFDFFSGTMSWRDKTNPFNKMGLGSKQTNVPYYRVSGETAKRVLAVRAYPELPQTVVEDP